MKRAAQILDEGFRKSTVFGGRVPRVAGQVFVLWTLSVMPEGSFASLENPGVFSCNIEFRGQAPEALKRVHACRRGVLLAMENGEPERARTQCEGEFSTERSWGGLIACLAGVRNFFSSR